MAIQGVFKRYEKKYVLTPEQFEQITPELTEHMKLDEYGLHTICSLYYDTPDKDLIRASIEKPVYKEKLRLRSYGKECTADSIVFIELKKKYKGIVYKRRVTMTLCDAKKYIQGIRPENETQIMREIDWFLDFYKPVPSTLVAYDRLAYFGNDDENFRVTFDKNIRCRDYDLDLELGDFGEVITDEGYSVMEIKTTGAIPLWLCDLLTKLEIYPASFSKYGTFYTQTLLKTHSQEVYTNA